MKPEDFPIASIIKPEPVENESKPNNDSSSPISKMPENDENTVSSPSASSSNANQNENNLNSASAEPEVTNAENKQEDTRVNTTEKAPISNGSWELTFEENLFLLEFDLFNE
ncbi:hypothetical protein [Reichenbachiella versicolor]|uniref:hypothetical protein n=1 Tax=Reichenbachiella versicolor TaxID=1821036 RepID=UPI000D6E303A|nr:hypothetical protein [Reichenbachiella versicolor]